MRWIFAFTTTFLLSFTALFSAAAAIIPEMPEQATSFVYHGADPIEIRDQSVYRWLSCECRIENPSAHCYGSGTLCYYDRSKNIGYIITCAHLFNGGEKTVQIDFWHKNGQKLPDKQRFTADVIGYDSREDVAFLKFTPDWVPNEWFPIAPINTNVEKGQHLWSAGCDGAREVAAYNVKAVGMEGSGSETFLITRENSPRHGRSGGGLMNDDGWYVGICVRSSDAVHGTGTGLFVPLSRIYPVAKKFNVEFLLTCGKACNQIQVIPIVDRVEPQGQYPKDYIPVP
jgi:hypothetical protein